MAKQVVECFFCKDEVDLNGHHFTIKGPDEKIHMVHEHTGVREHGGVEVNAPTPEKEEVSE